MNKINKMNYSKINTFVISIIIVIIVILVIALLYTILDKKNNKNATEYKFVLPFSGNGENMNNCPKGCVRGRCETHNSNKPENHDNKHNKHNKHNLHCKYDFDCQYCRNPDTNMFYVDGNYNNEKIIIPHYDDKNYNQSQLNREIIADNKYIHELNEEIIKHNNQIKTK